jgi:segregation and condensation protein A
VKPNKLYNMSITPSVSLDNFEGPLDLLLHLIQKEEIDIYNIPLADMTRKFLISFIEESEKKLDLGAEFLNGTSLLLLLKSRRLIPSDTTDENLNNDNITTLFNELIEYSTFKEVAKRLSQREETALNHFFRGVELVEIEKPSLAPNKYTINDLSKLLLNLLKKKEVALQPIKDEEFKVEERLLYLNDLFQKQKEISFDEIFNIKKTKEELIATFLAVLQLIKNQKLKAVNQDHHLLLVYE